ncbi:pseudouridine synthase [Methylibium rhizosphaerae]|uniref:pseudouridine synthase n=1 Tax=Methylibium rhizosphaerae TaxID=2570323 RepID=UPI001129D8E5|nr:pseudouridine synthase [Methylibium rhizosphaerae]
MTAPEIVFADDTLIVADKPAGLLAVPGRGADKQDCLSARVQALHADALIVHRLDMATSGLLVLARGAQAQRSLSIAFARRLVHKRYTAVVAGSVQSPEGRIELPLICDWPNRPRQKVHHSLGKPSLTLYRVLQHDRTHGTTRVELEPVTGRSHQLRVHLAELGHAILGDALYASPEVHAMAPRLLLHASLLQLPHPRTGEPMTFESPAPF